MYTNLLLINNSFNAPLSKDIQKTYNTLIETIVQIPPNLYSVKEIPFTDGNASVTNIIAYQIGWGKLLINWYITGLKNKMPLMPGEGFSKWDYKGLAHHFYEKYKYDDMNIQLQEFYNTVTAIISIVEKEYETDNLEKLGIWKWCAISSGKQWPLSKWIKVNTVSPYKRATGLIRKFLKNQS